MQGIIVTPSGDIWAADTMKSQLVHFPKGDPSKGELLCQNPSGDPLKNPCKLVLPFALAVDQQRQHLGHQHPRRPRHALPRWRRHQTRDLQDRLLRQRPRRRQSRQRLDHQQARQFRARPPENARDGGCGEGQLRRRPRLSRQAHPRAGRRHGRTEARLGGRQPDGPAPRRHRGEVLADLRQGHLWSLGGLGRRQRQHLGFELHQCGGRDRAISAASAPRTARQA